MTSSSDYMVDRRRLRRKLGLWRLAAIGAALLAALAFAARFNGFDEIEHSSPHIARLSIEGVITGDRDTLDLIQKVADSHASAVILRIESPGGTTDGAEALYLELRKLAQKKPTVAVVGSLAASGGYIAALGADRILVRGNSLVGSIGVLIQIRNLYKGLDMLGIKVEELRSSPLKDAPNGLEPTSDAAKAAMNVLIADSYAWFRGLVKERRSLDDSELAKVDDGRIFTGRQGISLRLADAIGGEAEAIEWLQTEKNVAKKLPVRDWKKKTNLEARGLLGLASAGARLAGLEVLAGAFDALSARSGPNLDGLLAIWQGPSTH